MSWRKKHDNVLLRLKAEFDSVIFDTVLPKLALHLIEPQIKVAAFTYILWLFKTSTLNVPPLNFINCKVLLQLLKKLERCLCISLCKSFCNLCNLYHTVYPSPSTTVSVMYNINSPHLHFISCNDPLLLMHISWYVGSIGRQTEYYHWYLLVF